MELPHAIRRLTPEQFNDLTALIIALANYENLTPPDAEAFARMREHAFSEKPKFEAFLYYINDEAAGYAIIFETYSSFLAKPTLYLEDLFVLPEHRAKKIGFEMFQFLSNEALRRGCGRMEWQVLDWNVLALNFYRRFGAQHLENWLPHRLTEEELQKIACNFQTKLSKHL